MEVVVVRANKLFQYFCNDADPSCEYHPQTYFVFGKVPNQRFLIVSCIKIADYFLASEVLPVVAKTTTVVWERPVF